MEHMDHHKEDHEHMSMVEGENKPIEYFKFVLVIAAITLMSYWLNNTYGGNNYDWMRYFMGVFFTVFALFKFIGYKMFVSMYAGYDIIAKKSKTYSYLYPFIELGLGILYLWNFIPEIRDIITLAIMLVGSIGVFREIYKRNTGIHCACLGNIIRLPLSTVTLIEDVGMAIMASVMIVLRSVS